MHWTLFSFVKVWQELCTRRTFDSCETWPSHLIVIGWFKADVTEGTQADESSDVIGGGGGGDALPR